MNVVLLELYWIIAGTRLEVASRPNANGLGVIISTSTPRSSLPLSHMHITLGLVTMDDDDFDDLFSEVDFLPGSSQVSLTDAAANMSFGGSVGDEAYASEDNLAAPEDTDMLDQWPEEAFEDQEPPLKLEPK